jgi:hypothetical protein
MASMDPTPKPASRRKRFSAGSAIGAFVVEIDQRLLRNVPPAEELVAKAAPVRGLSGEPGTFDLGRITVVVPPPLQAATETAAEDPAGSPADGQPTARDARATEPG